MRRLEPNESAVRTGERERFRIAVDGIAADNMFERNPFVPAVPLLSATKRTVHASAAASQEIENLHWIHPCPAEAVRTRQRHEQASSVDVPVGATSDDSNGSDIRPPVSQPGLESADLYAGVVVASSSTLALRNELERRGTTFRRGRAGYISMTDYGQSVALSGPTYEEPRRWWRGTATAALELLTPLPDGADLDAIWRALRATS